MTRCDWQTQLCASVTSPISGGAMMDDADASFTHEIATDSIFCSCLFLFTLYCKKSLLDCGSRLSRLTALILLRTAPQATTKLCYHLQCYCSDAFWPEASSKLLKFPLIISRSRSLGIPTNLTSLGLTRCTVKLLRGQSIVVS